MKMSEQDYELRIRSIQAQWEASRRESWEYDDSDVKAKRIVNDADRWQFEQLAQLNHDSGWTMEEIGAWFVKWVANEAQRLGGELPQ